MAQSNSTVLVRQVVKSAAEKLVPSISADDYFERFSASQILKELDPSYDEVESGIVDGGDDGGVDSAYVFVDDFIVSEDDDLPEIDKIRKHAQVNVYITQSKFSDSFKANALNKLVAFLPKLLDLNASVSDYADELNQTVRERFGVIRAVIRTTAPRMPNIRFFVNLVSLGDVANLPGNVTAARESVRAVIQESFPTAHVEVNLIGANRLWELYTREPPAAFQIDLKETPIPSGNRSYVGLARLSEYVKFLSDENGHIRHGIFDENIRDFQNYNPVNEQISEYITGNDPSDFWWLNNGVTILTTKLDVNGKTFSIQNPKIVNGLQTSYVLYDFRSHLNEGHNSEKSVLVRVIQASNDDIREPIIRATNTQTVVPIASLRAVDPLHRQLEQYFQGRGWHYERRKNHYKNLGKDPATILSIQYLAQAVMTIALGEPDNARARPSSLLGDDNRYRRVFPDSRNLEVYLRCFEFVKTVDNWLRDPLHGLTSAERNNLIFHIAYAFSRMLGKKLDLNDADIERLTIDEGDKKLFSRAVSEVSSLVEDLMAEESVSMDRICKSRKLVTEVRAGVAVWMSNNSE